MRKLRISVSTAIMFLLIGLFSVVAFAAEEPDRTTFSNQEMSPAQNETGDNGIVNANKSGTSTNINDGTLVNDVIKSDGMVKNDGSVGTHRTHGEYQNNTNSCASCHQTHTAESKSLLFKNGVYNTCTACHDGTLGFYNVFEGSNAGTFGGTHSGNMSVHLATGAVKISAAPGGKANGTGSWTGDFTCASCHSPHGSYSDRLLHYNPNTMGINTKADGGIGVKGAAVSEGVPTSGVTDASPEYVIVRETATSYGLTKADVGITNDDAVTTDDDAFAATKVVSLYKLKKATTSPVAPAQYVKDTNPWLYGYEFQTIGGKRTKVYYTGFSETTMSDSDLNKVWNYDDKSIHVMFGKGYAYTTGTDLDKIVIGNIARAYVTKLALEPNPDYTLEDYGVQITKNNQATLLATSGKGVAVSAYCSSCHTDYYGHSGDGEVLDGKGTGTWNQAYRHSTDSDSYTCVRCHYAHGTDVTVMKDAEGHTVDEIVTDTTGFYWPEITDATERKTKATDYMLDKNPSSALKRFTNMAVCWSCHTSSKADQLKNNSFYNDNYDTVPHGLPTGN
jgi:predicted CXXCH cytochrome family protein